MRENYVQKTALVLGGGGSLGAYELGVWKALRELNIKFDIVTGTSIGALNGAFVAMDDFKLCEKLWLTITPEKVIKNGINLTVKSLTKYSDYLNSESKIRQFISSFVRNKGADITPFKELSQQFIDVKKIKDSKIDFGIVVAKFPQRIECHVNVKNLPNELVLPYLHASSACWPIFPIEKIINTKFIDGGYKDTLPIDFALELGATNIISVNLKGIPKVPQKSYLKNLPFVRNIEPYSSLGSIMDFSQETIVRNIQLGYNDTKKSFGEYSGNEYTFKKEKLIDLLSLDFTALMSKLPIKILDKIDDLLWEKDDSTNIHDCFVRVVELLARECNIDPSKVYSISEMIQLIDENFSKEFEDLDFIQQIIVKPKKIKTGKSGLKSFVAYLRNLYINEGRIHNSLLEKIPFPIYHLAYCFYLTITNKKVISL
jgi:NTE family protein